MIQPDQSGKPQATQNTAPRMIAPQDMDAGQRRRLSAPGLRTFLNIADHWDLTEKERLTVLGHPSRSAYYGWIKKAQQGQDLSLSVDVLLRISAVLGIFKALKILFHQPDQALTWLRGAHRGLPFSGQAPMNLLTSGTQDGLLTLRRYLDAWRGGNAAHAGPGDDIEPVTRDTLIFG